MSQDIAPDAHALTREQQKVWATGDFHEIARQNVAIAEAVCEAADPRPGQRVLDVACGSGTAALVAARRYCEVVGLDYVPELVERAKIQARSSGLGARFEVADAQDLPFPDDSFDVVLSVFGVQFAPDQERSAREMTRVCRPGGTIALAGPRPGTMAGDMFAAVGEHAPPPPGVDPPLRWATEDGLDELFGDAVTSIQLQERSTWAYWRSVDHAIEVLTTYMGPIVRALDGLDPAAQASLREDLREVFERHNRAKDGTAVIENGFMQTLATLR